MGSELRQSASHILTWVLYASAGFGALAYALFLRSRRDLRAFKEAHGLLSVTALHPRDAIEQKLHGVEALRGLAIVVMLVGFLFWPLLILGVLLFFFQTNAWKSTQRDLVALDKEHPEHRQAQQRSVDALEAATRNILQVLERRGSTWQRVFAITMGVALLVACGLLLVTVNWFSTTAPVPS